MVTPRTSWKAVSKGPAVSAGSKPSRLDTRGIAVPANPEMVTETNMEMATTRAKADECHRSPIRPTPTAHTAPMIIDVWICRQSGSPPHELDLARGQTSHD